MIRHKSRIRIRPRQCVVKEQRAGTVKEDRAGEHRRQNNQEAPHGVLFRSQTAGQA
jgi:hypothetical protein